MFAGGYFLLIVVGALLHWAVTYRASGFNIQVAGLIIMILGIVGLAIAVLFWFDGRGYAAPWRHSDYIHSQAPCVPDDRVVHERVVREQTPRERVVREYVPPPREGEENTVEQPRPPGTGARSEDTTDSWSRPIGPRSN